MAGLLIFGILPNRTRWRSLEDLVKEWKRSTGSWNAEQTGARETGASPAGRKG